MKILAGNITELVDTFLHSGYVSAYPRHFSVSWLKDKEPVVTLDMVEALRLLHPEGGQEAPGLPPPVFF